MQSAGSHVDGPEMPAAVLAEAGEDGRRVEKPVPAQAERPGRSGKFGRHRQDGPRGAVLGAIQVPPATSVGHEIQLAVRRPGRLHDRLALAACDLAHVAEAAVGGNFGRPEPGAVPGHVGVIPGEPGQTIACVAEPGRAEEVVAVDENAAVVAAGQGERDDGVDRLACRPVVLPDREHAAAGEIQLEIGVAQLAIARRGQGLRR